MKYLFFLFTLFGAITAHSQCSEFDRLLREGDNYLKKTNYQEAINSYTTAIIACSGRAEEAKHRIAKMVSDINKLKAAAEEQRKIAASAFQNLQRISDQAVPIVLTDIDRDIYRLQYDSTYEKCKAAVGLNARRPEAEKRIWEIAYFYTEADTAAAAVVFLELLDTTIRLTAETPGLQQKLRDYLKKAVPAAYLNFLNKRYYPDTVLIEGGSFGREITIRDEDYRRTDTVVQVRMDSFYIGRTEITYWQYNVFARAKKHYIESPPWEFCGDNPAVFVNWYDAAFYFNWLSERHKKNAVYMLTNPQKGLFAIDYDVAINTTANGYHLPTEAEWEFAARGGNCSMGYEYSGDSIPDSVAWYSGNSNNRTQPVGELKKNELGLYDMSGNVWEWCEDWYANSPARVIRGGSWGDNAVYCRATNRYAHAPGSRINDVGFRLVFVP